MLYMLHATSRGETHNRSAAFPLVYSLSLCLSTRLLDVDVPEQKLHFFFLSLQFTDTEMKMLAKCN